MYEDAEDALKENPLALAQLGEEPMRNLERRVVIATVDRLWREHLYEMDYLKEGIGLRAMGQRDPLVEYKDEGAKMFQAMMERIREESVQQVFAFAKQFDKALEQAREKGLFDQGAPSASEASDSPSLDAVAAAEAAAEAKAAEKAAQAARSAEQRARTARASSVMGDLGQARTTAALRYSSSEGEASSSGSPAASQGSSNREQRRAAAKKARKRR